MTRESAAALAADTNVEYVLQDQYLANAASSPPVQTGSSVAGTQTPVTWALDRIDQHALPLDNHYSYDESAGQGVNAYVLSTGILATHPDLAGRVIGGGNFIFDGRSSTSDCHGAGTRLAGVIGGTEFGVAKLATLVSVRKADCNNVTTVSAYVSAFDWVVANAVLPAVLVSVTLAPSSFFSTHDPSVIAAFPATSARAPRLEEITGRPVAMASSTGRPKPS